MPGFEVIGKEEELAISEIFRKDKGILFAHGFDQLRKRYRVREFEKKIAKKFKVTYTQAVSSGTAALFVALKALGVKSGDEVITQSFTFVATVEAILMLGAVPVITEIDDTYNMDPNDLISKITNKTRAIIPVHMAGVSADMGKILTIARQHHLPVLEDTAQAIAAKYNGKYLGTLGDVGTFSFDFGKTLTTGEGGMLLTNNKKIFEAALAFHDHGHEYHPGFKRADDTRKIWGFNFRMSELNAAVGLVQLKKLNSLIERATYVKNTIKTKIKSSCSNAYFRKIPIGCVESCDSIIFSLPSRAETLFVLDKFKKKNIGTKNIPDALKWHFTGYWEHIFTKNLWPHSQDLLERSIALPIMSNWDNSFIEQYTDKVIKALKVR